MASPACKVIFVLGPPCSGKTTLCSTLAETGGWKLVEIDDQVDKDLQFETAVRKGDRLLVSGFPLESCSIDLFQSRWPEVNVLMTLLLEAPYCVLKARHDAKAKVSKLKFRGSSSNFQLQWQDFVQKTEPIVEHFRGIGLLRCLDATASVEWVLAEARAHLKPTVIFVTGPPGCGKSVLCQRLLQKACEGPDRSLVHYIGIGDLIRRQTHLCSYIEEGKLVPSKIVMNLISEETKALGQEGRVFIIDGFPRSPENLHAWNNTKNVPAVALTLHISCPEEVCQQRISSRGRVDDVIFKKRYTVYKEEALAALLLLKCSDCPLFCNVLDIDGTVPMSDLVDQTFGLVRSHLPCTISVGHRAVTFLRTWLDEAKNCEWTKLADETAGRYAQFLSECMSSTTEAPAPSADVWLCWVTHLLRTEDFKSHAASSCTAARNVRPPSMKSATVGKETSPELQELLLLVPGTARAFVEALGMLDFGGLRPLSNPLTWMNAGECLEKLLALLTHHYRRYLYLSQKAWEKGERLAPPMELDWLWHAHIIHGDAYADDCKRLHGTVIPHRPEEPGKSEAVQCSLGDELLLIFRKDITKFAEQQQKSLKQLQDVHKKERRSRSANLEVNCLGSLLPIEQFQVQAKLNQSGGDVGAALAAAVLVSDLWETTTSNISVEVSMVSGDSIFKGELNSDSTLKDLRLILAEQALIPTGTDPSFARAGPSVGAKMSDSDQLYCGSSEVSITMVLGAAKEPELSGWTCPRCGQQDAPRGPGYPCADCYGPNGRTNNAMCSCCSCFTYDCEFTVLRDHAPIVCLMCDLQVGDHVLTGRGNYRRITRIWSTPVNGHTATVQLTPGCRLTCGHPVFQGSRWRRPEDITSPFISYEENVCTIEIEGHDDTLSVGGIICAAIGVYCGEEFGWNIFTRKTVRCDVRGCNLCNLIVDASIDFAAVVPDDLVVRYEPYLQESMLTGPTFEEFSESHLVTA